MLLEMLFGLTHSLRYTTVSASPDKTALVSSHFLILCERHHLIHMLIHCSCQIIPVTDLAKCSWLYCSGPLYPNSENFSDLMLRWFSRDSNGQRKNIVSTAHPIQTGPLKVQRVMLLLWGTTTFPLLAKSSQTPVAAHLKCPPGCRRPERPPPLAGALRNSQRPGKWMKRRRRYFKATARLKTF